MWSNIELIKHQSNEHRDLNLYEVNIHSSHDEQYNNDAVLFQIQSLVLLKFIFNMLLCMTKQRL